MWNQIHTHTHTLTHTHTHNVESKGARARMHQDLRRKWPIHHNGDQATAGADWSGRRDGADHGKISASLSPLRAVLVLVHSGGCSGPPHRSRDRAVVRQCKFELAALLLQGPEVLYSASVTPMTWPDHQQQLLHQLPSQSHHHTLLLLYSCLAQFHYDSVIIIPLLLQPNTVLHVYAWIVKAWLFTSTLMPTVNSCSLLTHHDHLWEELTCNYM